LINSTEICRNAFLQIWVDQLDSNSQERLPANLSRLTWLSSYIYKIFILFPVQEGSIPPRWRAWRNEWRNHLKS
jgi:hypothetical protein